MDYRYQMMNGNDPSWGIVMMLFWTAFIIVVIVVAVRLLKSHETSHHHASSSPMDIAKERYAKGEIKKEEFEQIKKDLKA